jgi:hypothetical protein
MTVSLKYGYIAASKYGVELLSVSARDGPANIAVGVVFGHIVHN